MLVVPVVSASSTIHYEVRRWHVAGRVVPEALVRGW